MAEPPEMPEGWREERRKAGPAYDRESWQDIAREWMRFNSWDVWDRSLILPSLAVVAVFIAVAAIAVVLAT